MLVFQSFPWTRGPCCSVGLSADRCSSRGLLPALGLTGSGEAEPGGFLHLTTFHSPKYPHSPRFGGGNHRASPGCCPASKETGRSGVQAFLKWPFLFSAARGSWVGPISAPTDRVTHLPPQILHPKFGTAGTGRGKHVKDPEVKSYRERLHPGR